MDTEYIAALIRRGEYGRAAHVAIAVWLMAGQQLGRVIRLPVWSEDPNVPSVAALIGCGRRQAERHTAAAIRLGLVERVGKQDLRASQIAHWRREKMSPSTGAERRSSPPYSAGIPPAYNDGAYRRKETEFSGAERRGDDDTLHRRKAPVTGRRSTGVTALLPPHTPPSSDVDVKDHETRKETTAAPAPTASFLNIQSGGSGHGWAYGAAKHACRTLGFANSDANGIASELRKFSDLRDSVISLLEDICTNPQRIPDGGWKNGAGVVMELRECMPEWTSGPVGPAYRNARDVIAEKNAEYADLPTEPPPTTAEDHAEAGRDNWNAVGDSIPEHLKETDPND